MRPLRRLAGIAWAAWLLSLVYLWGQHLARTLHPPVLVLPALVAITFAASLSALVLGLLRMGQRTLRWPALGWTVAALLPVLGWAGLAGYALGCGPGGMVPFNPAMVLMSRAGHNLMETEALYRYPHRRESSRLVMFYREGLDDPDGDLQAMDAHVARLEALTGRPLQEKIYWVRGTALGRGALCCYSAALGSDRSPAEALDRHELAHAVINQTYTPATDPPTLLAEGWAESQSVSEAELAERAVSFRTLLEDCRRLPEAEARHALGAIRYGEKFEPVLAAARASGTTPSYLRALTSDPWYHLDTGPVYSAGGAFASFVIRKYGAPAFVDLYLACRPGTFEAECRRVLGTGLDALEREFWADAEHLARL